jgi:hypothetical protein
MDARDQADDVSDRLTNIFQKIEDSFNKLPEEPENMFEFAHSLEVLGNQMIEASKQLKGLMDFHDYVHLSKPKLDNKLLEMCEKKECDDISIEYAESHKTK